MGDEYQYLIRNILLSQNTETNCCISCTVKQIPQRPRSKKSVVLVDWHRCHFCTSQFHTEAKVPPAKASGWEGGCTLALLGHFLEADKMFFAAEILPARAFVSLKLPQLRFFLVTPINSVEDEKCEMR